MLTSWSVCSLEGMLEAELRDLAAPPPAASSHQGVVAAHGDTLLDDDALLMELCHDDVYARAAPAGSAADAAAAFNASARTSPPSVQSSWQEPALLLGGSELADVPAGAGHDDMPTAAQQGGAAGTPCWPGAFSAHSFGSMFEPAAAAAQLQQPAAQPPTGSPVSSGHSLSAGTCWAPQQPQQDGNAPVLMMLPWSVAMSVMATAGGSGASLMPPSTPAPPAPAAGVPVQPARRAVRVKRCVSESILQPQSRFKTPRPAGMATMQPVEASQGSECQLRNELLRKRQQRLRVQAKLALLQRQQLPGQVPSCSV